MEEEPVNTNELEFSKILEILVKKKIAILILTIFSSISLAVYLNTGTPIYKTLLRVQVAPSVYQTHVAKEIVRQAKNLFDDKVKPVKNHQGAVDFYEFGTSTTTRKAHINKVLEYIKKFQSEYRSNYDSQLQEYQKQITLVRVEINSIKEIVRKNSKSGKVFVDYDLCRSIRYNKILNKRCHLLMNESGELNSLMLRHITNHDIDHFSVDLSKSSIYIYNTTREKLIKAINAVLIGFVLLLLLLILREFSNIRDRNIA
jgi:hypothetical protein